MKINRRPTIDQNHQILMIMTLLLSLSSASLADISRDVRRSDSGQSQNHENYLELGIGMAAYKSPAILGEKNKAIIGTVALNTRFQWQELFIEAFTESYQGLILGYNAYQSEQWALDIVATSQFAEISKSQYGELIGLKTRKADAVMGIRTIGYFDNILVQFQALKDISNTHNGIGLSALIGRNWQYRNWNFHSLLGARFEPGKTLDYYYGVDADEASSQFPEYQLSSNQMYTFEIGTTYPLSEKWIIRSTLIYADIPKAITDSPLIDRTSSNNFSFFGLNLNYVF